MKHIVSFSGGKDSTAMLLRMLEENMQVDEILFCDTGKDFPDMLEHIEKVKKYIKEKYNKEILTLKAKKVLIIICLNMRKQEAKTKGKKAMAGQLCFADGVQAI